MPKATVSLAPVHYDLNTVEGGFVKLRRMGYGKKLDRAQNATRQTMRGTEDQLSEKEEAEMMMEIMQRRTAEIEFRECIVEHNLEDDDGKLLDFRIPATLGALDPQIGEEITTLISNLLNYEGEVNEPGNSTTASKE